MNYICFPAILVLMAKPKQSTVKFLIIGYVNRRGMINRGKRSSREEQHHCAILGAICSRGYLLSGLYEVSKHAVETLPGRVHRGPVWSE